MGNLLLLFQIIAISVLPSSNENTTKIGPKISFEKTTIKLGDIYPEEKYERVFTFTNIGDEPLIIIDTETSCGCTVADFPKEPIMPGKKGEIKVDYIPKKNTKGFISKSVTIKTNAVNSPQYVYFQGNVVKKDKKKKRKK